MSWENDKGIIIFMLVLVVFIVFCAFMTVRSSKKKKENNLDGDAKQLHTQEATQSLFGYGFGIFLAVIWLASAILILVLYYTGNLNYPFTVEIPRVLALPYELFGIIGGAIVQIIICVGIMVSSIRSIISVKRKK